MKLDNWKRLFGIVITTAIIYAMLRVSPAVFQKCWNFIWLAPCSLIVSIIASLVTCTDFYTQRACDELALHSFYLIAITIIEGVIFSWLLVPVIGVVNNMLIWTFGFCAVMNCLLFLHFVRVIKYVDAYIDDF